MDAMENIEIFAVIALLDFCVQNLSNFQIYILYLEDGKF